MHALKLTFQRWYTIMLQGRRLDQPFPCPKHDFFLLKVTNITYQLYLEHSHILLIPIL